MVNGPLATQLTSPMISDAPSAGRTSLDLNPRLRPCEPNDVPQITAIYAHAVRHGRASFELEPPDKAEMEQRRNALVGAGYPYLVAEIGGWWSAMLMPVPTDQGPPTAARSRIRSM